MPFRGSGFALALFQESFGPRDEFNGQLINFEFLVVEIELHHLDSLFYPAPLPDPAVALPLCSMLDTPCSTVVLSSH